MKKQRDKLSRDTHNRKTRLDTNHHTFPLAEQETYLYLTAIKQWVFYLNLDYVTFSVNVLLKRTGNLVFEILNYATILTISRPSREGICCHFQSSQHPVHNTANKQWN
uniref:Uncharacterized protein n=1 Tax=Micrurus paraensis TaxID=1970185 RepID=A0A2D4K519_9SAUR